MSRRLMTILAEMPLLWCGIATLLLTVFIVDSVTSLEIAAAVLYVAAILLSARTGRSGVILAIGATSAALTFFSYLLNNSGLRQQGLVNSVLSLLAIAAVTYLAYRFSQTEARNRAAQAELAHMARITVLGELAASITHEVSQPLAGIGASAHAAVRWLAVEPAQPEEVRRALALVIRDADRAREVIGRVRALAQRAPPRHEPVDLASTIQDVIGLVRSELRKHDVTLRIELGEGLPVILGDRVQLQQVVLNFLMNAVDAINGSESQFRDVLVSAVTDTRTVTVSVRDTGTGLPDDAIGQAFDAFFTTKPYGMGLGLSISRSIVEAHGGSIHAARNLPHGMVFGFTLPAAKRGSSIHG